MRTPITPRDAYLYHEIAKAERCRPISETIRLCAIDVATILGVACFIWFIIWGIPLLIRGYKWYKSKRRGQPDLPLSSDVDEEKGSLTPSSSEPSFMDPFLSPSWKLHDYLQNREGPMTPAPVYKAEAKAKQVCFKNVELDKYALSPSLDNTFSTSLSSSELQLVHHSSSDLVFVSESSVIHSSYSGDPLLSTPPPARLARSNATDAQTRDSFNPYIW